MAVRQHNVFALACVLVHMLATFELFIFVQGLVLLSWMQLFIWCFLKPSALHCQIKSTSWPSVIVLASDFL